MKTSKLLSRDIAKFEQPLKFNSHLSMQCRTEANVENSSLIPFDGFCMFMSAWLYMWGWWKNVLISDSIAVITQQEDDIGRNE